MLTCDPVTCSCFWALFKAVGWVMTRLLSPAALAWKLKTQIVPAPLKPGDPGGREALMLIRPGPSSR